MLDEFTRVTFPYEILLGDPLPADVDPACLEVQTLNTMPLCLTDLRKPLQRYLSDDEFLKVLKMTREEYARLPLEQQEEIKRRVYLL